MGNILIVLGGLIVLIAWMWLIIKVIIQLGDDDDFKKWLSGN